MRRTPFLVACMALMAAVLISGQSKSPLSGVRTASGPRAALPSHSSADVRAMLDQHCVMCHSARIKSGGVALDGPDLSALVKDAAPWERSVRKLRAGMMPPAGSPVLSPEEREA